MLPNFDYSALGNDSTRLPNRRFVLAAAAGGLAALALAGCERQSDDRFKVVTSFTVIADIARNVAGEAAQVESITPPGAEIHNYQPTPGDLLRAQDADLILWNGLNLELWFERFFQNLSGVPDARLSSALATLFALLPSAAIGADAPRDIGEALHGRLIRAEAGRLVPAPLPRRARLIAFYFGASWCGPCRVFQPELRRGYEGLRAAGTPVEIVFVSDDSGCRPMADYILSMRMTWSAVRCRDRARLGWLHRERGAALPGLLVYDRTGRLLVSSWSPSGRSHPRAALEKLKAIASDTEGRRPSTAK